MPPALRRAVRSVQRHVLSFFDGTGREAEAHPDPLLDVAQQYPTEAAWFIKVVMFYGSVSSLVVVLPCGLFLLLYWDPCRQCNRPLRCWLALHCLLQLVQAPVRIVFYLRVQEIQRLNGDIQECMRRLTQAPAWKSSKGVSIASYAWFVLGVVWSLNSTYCESCPGLYRLCLTVVVSSFLKLLMTLVVFNRCFPVRGEAVPTPKPRGASQVLIESLPLFEYGKEQEEQEASLRRGDSCRDSCAVCLSDFEGGEQLRRLPCAHCFHQACIDRWLRRNQVCPLCLRDVEEAADLKVDKKQI
ncbi:unnamed protein product [Effrenium voratum]|nr:unnamed protein product [Effrenium voratum]CAJ1449490.1 unnamed protein product [Effrenium voratum]|mmetsp:Transcript_65032/g.155301  ORF Transcript_65032/g.155301 Transcript_65032/m.155301 type:complete len:299 (-) Transcript_65032:162-1058(-)